MNGTWGFLLRGSSSSQRALKGRRRCWGLRASALGHWLVISATACHLPPGKLLPVPRGAVPAAPCRGRGRTEDRGGRVRCPPAGRQRVWSTQTTRARRVLTRLPQEPLRFCSSSCPPNDFGSSSSADSLKTGKCVSKGSMSGTEGAATWDSHVSLLESN